MPHSTPASIGIIGLGQIGGGVAANLIKAGYPVIGFDIATGAMERLTKMGGRPAGTIDELLNECHTVMTSLVWPVMREVFDEHLLPHCRPGSILIDLSTVPAPMARIMAERLSPRGVFMLDCPVTGGPGPAAEGTLRTFVGGPRAVFQKCLPILEAFSREDGITYGGESGQGQVLKVVQQLKHRITDAVRLEVINFGARAGLSMEQIARALDCRPGDQDPYQRLIDTITAGRGDELGCLITEWSYYLEEARARNIPMPALEALDRFCHEGQPVFTDTQGRRGPSVWRELSNRGRSQPE
ncbi:MAG: NAD(P)-dependent oxidoreductase [Phycisphaeraceae bacterium]|nr:NAD(P)-dependent oxidoreductase [Phycisphaeraceae bacterium]